MRRSFHIFLLIVFVTEQGCTRDKAALPMANKIICDSMSVSYHSCVKPILQSNCYSCHSDSASAGGSAGFDIEDFSQLKFYLNYYYHNDSVYGSKFMRAIEHKSGVLVMPPSYKIPDSSIAIIRSWIRLGAPDS